MVNRFLLNKPRGSAKQPLSATRHRLYWLLFLLLLCPLTWWGTTQNFRWTMMALVTFFLAYVSKGVRNRYRHRPR